MFRTFLAIEFIFVLSIFAAAQAKTVLRPVTIISEPNAAVAIDGVAYGRTDAAGKLSVVTIPAGVRKLFVRAPGYSPASQNIPAAQKGQIRIVLKKTEDPVELALQDALRLSLLDRPKAVAAYKKVLELDGKNIEALIGMARMYSDMNDFDSVAETLVRIRKLAPALPEASAIEGRMLHSTEHDDAALKAYQRAIAQARGFQPEAYTGIGVIFKERAENFGGGIDVEQEAANFTEAAKNWSIAVKQLGGSPDAVVVYQLLGLIYEEQKKFKQAIDLYEEFLRTFPQSPEAEAVRSYIIQLKKQMVSPQ